MVVLAILGAAAGLAAAVYLITKMTRQDSNANVYLILWGCPSFGALAGVELYFSRGWSERGPWWHLGRWCLAFGSAAATMGSLFLIAGKISQREYWSGIGVAIGFVACHVIYDAHKSDFEKWPDAPIATFRALFIPLYLAATLLIFQAFYFWRD